MTFKIGDSVHPKSVIPVSNKKNMWDDETGTIIGISAWNDGHVVLTVKRDEDGEIFEGMETEWELA